MTNYNNIINKVKRPSRYINGEWNSYHKKWEDVQTKVCLAFPDLYELGSSGLGLEILYHIINNRPDALAERAFSPDFDMEEELRSSKAPLFSLESKKPLSEFDIVGFSLEYELTYTNVLNMLDLAGIPLLASERAESFPLIIGGGPCTMNPEPVSDFFDIFALGDGEFVTGEIIDAFNKWKEQKTGKKELLKLLAGIEGVYVPSFYAPEKAEGKQTGKLEVIEEAASKVIVRRSGALDDAPFPHNQLVSFAQRVHDRLNIEIARGCPNPCKFCQARNYYFPYKQRKPERILELVEKGLKATGFDDIVLSSLSSSSYRGIKPLVEELTSRLKNRKVSLSLPSLRCDVSSLEIMDKLCEVKKSGLTFALEAGSERLRKEIGKPISADDIVSILTRAHRLGWKLIKLYFMIGLPGETDEDVREIPALIKRLKKENPRLNFNIAVSPFVPKPQTPYQWVSQETLASWQSKKSLLLKLTPGKVKFHDLRTSFLEGIFARGGRELNAVVRRAWELGAKFDQWGDRLKIELWEQAFRELSLDPASYLKARGMSDNLPWDHLTAKPSREVLEKGLNRPSLTEAKPQCVDEIAASPIKAVVKKEVRTVQKYRVRFSRSGNLRFLSHLEQIEMFRKIFRRSELPLNYSRGFSPQPLMSFGPAISVGHESESEYVDVELASRVELKQFTRSVVKELPEDLRLISAKTVPLIFPSIESSIGAAEYRVSGDFPEDMNLFIDKFEKKPEAVVTQIKKGKEVEIDVKPLVRGLEFKENSLLITLNFNLGKRVKPEKVLEALLSAPPAENFRISRKSVYMIKKTGGLIEI